MRPAGAWILIYTCSLNPVASYNKQQGAYILICILQLMSNMILWHSSRQSWCMARGPYSALLYLHAPFFCGHEGKKSQGFKLLALGFSVTPAAPLYSSCAESWALVISFTFLIAPTACVCLIQANVSKLSASVVPIATNQGRFMTRHIGPRSVSRVPVLVNLRPWLFF